MFLNVFMSFIHLYKPIFGLSVCPSVSSSVCPSSVCLPDSSESADARDLGLMTLFFFILFSYPYFVVFFFPPSLAFFPSHSPSLISVSVNIERENKRLSQNQVATAR